MQSRHGHENLVGRTGRIGAAQCPVEQRLVDRLVQGLPTFSVNSIDEQVGVKRRFAHKRQHVAGLGIQRHQGATPLTKQIFDQLLQADIEREHHGIARRGRVGGQLAYGAATRRSLDLLHAGGAVQLLLKALLNAQLADVVGTPVVAAVVAFFNAFFFCRVNAPDIADHVAAEIAVGVAAEQPCLDVYTRKAKALRCKTRDFLI